MKAADRTDAACATPELVAAPRLSIVPTRADVRHMRRAIALARLATKRPGASPIGCVIVRDGRILAQGHNEVDIRHDPTAHAEIVSLRRAGLAVGSADLRGGHCQGKLEYCVLGLLQRLAVTVFAQDSKFSDKHFRGQNGLCLFALTVPAT